MVSSETETYEWAPLRKARKDHRCTHCGRRIPRGRMYRARNLTPWDHPDNDSFAPYKAHPRCHEYWGIVGDETEWTFWDNPREWRRAMARDRLWKMQNRDRAIR